MGAKGQKAYFSWWRDMADKGYFRGPCTMSSPGLGKWPLLLPEENKRPELLRQSPGYPKGSIRCIGFDTTLFGDQ